MHPLQYKMEIPVGGKGVGGLTLKFPPWGYGYLLELHNYRCVQYFTDCFSAYMPTLPDKIEL